MIGLKLQIGCEATTTRTLEFCCTCCRRETTLSTAVSSLAHLTPPPRSFLCFVEHPPEGSDPRRSGVERSVVEFKALSRSQTSFHHVLETSVRTNPPNNLSRRTGAIRRRHPRLLKHYFWGESPSSLLSHISPHSPWKDE